MCYYVYADHAQYTIKTYAKMALFRLVLTGPLSVDLPLARPSVSSVHLCYTTEGVNHDSHTPLGSRIVTYDHYTTCMHAPTVLTRSGGHNHVIFSCEDLNALPYSTIGYVLSIAMS